MLKGEASGEERAEEAEETAVRSQSLQGKFIHHLQGRHKNRGQEGDGRTFYYAPAALPVSDTHTPLCLATQTQQSARTRHPPRPVSPCVLRIILNKSSGGARATVFQRVIPPRERAPSLRRVDGTGRNGRRHGSTVRCRPQEVAADATGADVLPHRPHFKNGSRKCSNYSVGA